MLLKLLETTSLVFDTIVTEASDTSRMNELDEFLDEVLWEMSC